MKNLLFISILFITNVIFGQDELQIFNNTNYKIKFQILVHGNTNDCSVILFNPPNMFESIQPFTVYNYSSFTDFNFTTWRRQINGITDTITMQDAVTTYNNPKWEYLKCDVYNRNNILQFSFPIGKNFCMGNDQTYTNGSFTATWTQNGSNEVSISFQN